MPLIGRFILALRIFAQIRGLASFAWYNRFHGEVRELVHLPLLLSCGAIISDGYDLPHFRHDHECHIFWGYQSEQCVRLGENPRHLATALLDCPVSVAVAPRRRLEEPAAHSLRGSMLT